MNLICEAANQNILIKSINDIYWQNGFVKNNNHRIKEVL